MLFTWLMLAGFILLFSPAYLTNKFPFAFTRIFRIPLNMSRDFALSAQTQQPLEEEATRTQTQYQNAYENLKKILEQQQIKLDRLYGLYNGSVWEGTDFSAVDVIGSPVLTGQRNQLYIDCRKESSLVKGLFILADNSVIGKISDVSSYTARIKLFTDVTSEVEVQIGDLNVKRTMQGNGDNTAKIKLMPLKYKIKKDDKVFACRQPGFLDSPMIVGEVAECKRDEKEPMLWDITVEPRCDIKNIKAVDIIIMNPKK